MNQVNKKPVSDKTAVSSLTLSNFRSYKFKRFDIDSDREDAFSTYDAEEIGKILDAVFNF